MSSANLLLYEFPCNEKIRTYLRLEALFQRFDWFCAEESPVAHQAALSALFDLLDATARSDLRNELIQELERHRQRLQVLRGNAEVNQEALIRLLDELGAAINSVAGSVGRTGQRIRENQWLQLIRTRLTIAGGACEFDLPLLHRWMNQPAGVRQNELHGYAAALDPIRNAAKLILRLLRSNASEEHLTAQRGTYQYPMKGGQSYALVQLRLPFDSPYIPEVSANKYMLWIRFSKPDADNRLHPVRSTDVPFTIGLCALA